MKITAPNKEWYLVESNACSEIYLLEEWTQAREPIQRIITPTNRSSMSLTMTQRFSFWRRFRRIGERSCTTHNGFVILNINNVSWVVDGALITNILTLILFMKIRISCLVFPISDGKHKISWGGDLFLGTRWRWETPIRVEKVCQVIAACSRVVAKHIGKCSVRSFLDLSGLLLPSSSSFPIFKITWILSFSDFL